ncbi:MAG: amidohydrolase family protein [Promethearchaeota archaeon]
MNIIDFQTQMTTKEGALFPKSAKKIFERTFKCKIPYYQTEEEMIEIFRSANIKAILVPPTATRKRFDVIKRKNDYVGNLIKKYPDVILGAWVMFDPKMDEWKSEMKRCISDLGFYGFFHYGASTGIPANGPLMKPYLDICLEYKVPVKISTGHTAAGAGMPGGGGLKLKTEQPIPYIDDVAADYPELTIIAAHLPWPYHHQMASVLIHKGNVYNEVHGWSPKYFPDEYKKDINGRLKKKILFGSDWPFFTFERLHEDWKSEGFKPEVLENIFYKNAEKILRLNK